MDAARAHAALSDEVGIRLPVPHPEQITRFLDGIELVEPCVVSLAAVAARPGPASPPVAVVDEFCGVGRKR
jgi:hypothetical protein